MTALTAAQAAFCVLLFGAGSVTTVAVQEARKAPAAKASKPAPAAKARPASVKPRAQLPREPHCIQVWPSVVVPDLRPIEITPFGQGATPLLALSEGPGGAILLPPPGPTIPPALPAIPEPDAWAMLIAGFGLVGLAMRRRGRQEGAA
jgi:hypothetical protein